jgi:hypothetical protein
VGDLKAAASSTGKSISEWKGNCGAKWGGSRHLAELLEAEDLVVGVEHGVEEIGELLHVRLVQATDAPDEESLSRLDGPESLRMVR